MNYHIADIADSLLAIEAEMRRGGHWSQEMPSEEALSSVQPFSIDTLTFPEWLQFIFLPRMTILVEKGGPFPSGSGITPMAEEYFRDSADSTKGLLDALRQMDELLSS